MLAATCTPKQRRNGRGWTLLELVVALTLASVVAATAVPQWQGQAQKVRRVDAMVALQGAQAAQERYRSLHPRYADSMSALGLQPHSPAGHYDLQVLQADDTGFGLLATAQAVSAQATDLPCARMGLIRRPFEVQWLRGEATGELAEDHDRRCWPR